MNKKDIMLLGTSGFMTATAHCLPSEAYYSWFRFRKFVNAEFAKLALEQQEIFRECDIDDPSEVPEDKANRYEGIFNAILKEEVELPKIPRIPLAYYKAIYDENKTEEKDIFKNIHVETLILDNLFTEE